MTDSPGLNTPDGPIAASAECDGGFTMVEVLVTMVLLTVVLTGTAALQIATIKRGTTSNRVGEAMRLGQSILAGYKSMRYSNIVSTSGVWIMELQRDGETEMKNVSANGEGNGPYSVERVVEASNGGLLITARVTWLNMNRRAAASTQYASQSVVLSLQRFP
jgi:prepilin-type N-terminal cleavage/methylation domain-containing protein